MVQAVLDDQLTEQTVKNFLKRDSESSSIVNI